MNRRRLPISILVASVLIFSGCDIPTQESPIPSSTAQESPPPASDIDFPVPAGPSGNPEFELAIDFPDVPDAVMVYKVINPVVDEYYVIPMGRKLGFTGGAGPVDGGTKIGMLDSTPGQVRHFQVWIASGAVDYAVTYPDLLYPPYQPTLPTDEEAIKIAMDFLEESGLMPPGGVSEPSVKVGGGHGASRTTETGEHETLYLYATHLLVSFAAPQIGGLPVAGGSKLGIRIGDKGVVVEALVGRRQVEPYQEMAIIKTPQQAFEELLTQKHFFCTQDVAKVLIDDIHLAYWMEPISERQNYVYPVYEFKGRILNSAGETIEFEDEFGGETYEMEFTGWVEAVE